MKGFAKDVWMLKMRERLMKSDAERYGSPLRYDEKEVGKIVDDLTKKAWDKGYNSGYRHGVEMAQEAIKSEFKDIVHNGILKDEE